MRAVLQRVTEAKVTVEGRVVGAIGGGLMVLIGVAEGDTEEDAVFIAGKIADLRLFDDAEGKINLSLGEMGGSVLAVSQFTLLGDCRKGRRPSWSGAAAPAEAERLYLFVVNQLRGRGITTECGVFGASMAVSLTNDGPVTLLLDSRKTF